MQVFAVVKPGAKFRFSRATSATPLDADRTGPNGAQMGLLCCGIRIRFDHHITAEESEALLDALHALERLQKSKPGQSRRAA